MHNARSLIAFKMCAPWKLSQTQIVEKRIKRRVGNLCIFVSLQTCFVDFISLLGMTEMLLYSCDSNNLRIICCLLIKDVSVRMFSISVISERICQSLLTSGSSGFHLTASFERIRTFHF